MNHPSKSVVELAQARSLSATPFCQCKQGLYHAKPGCHAGVLSALCLPRPASRADLTDSTGKKTELLRSGAGGA